MLVNSTELWKSRGQVFSENFEVWGGIKIIVETDGNF